MAHLRTLEADGKKVRSILFQTSYLIGTDRLDRFLMAVGLVMPEDRVPAETCEGCSFTVEAHGRCVPLS